MFGKLIGKLITAPIKIITMPIRTISDTIESKDDFVTAVTNSIEKQVEDIIE